MNTMTKMVFVGAVVGAAAFFAGNWMGRTGAQAEADKADVTAPAAKPKADDALARARKRINELESELAAMRAAKEASKAEAKLAEAQTQTEDADEVTTVPTPIPGSDAAISVSLGTSNEDILKQIKRQVPKEHFAEVTNVFAKMRERNLKKSRGKVQYLASIDTSNMTDKQRKSHQRYLELLTRMEELSAKNTGFLPDMSTLQQQVELQTELTPLAKEERKLLVDQLSRNLGYEGDDAAVIGETVQDIVDATSPSGMIGTAIATSVEEIGGMGLAPKPAKQE